MQGGNSRQKVESKYNYIYTCNTSKNMNTINDSIEIECYKHSCVVVKKGDPVRHKVRAPPHATSAPP